MKQEIVWAEHPRLPYEISDDGQVRTPEGRLIRQHITVDGYLRVRLLRPAHANHLVHRLVLEAFIGNCPPGHEAMHLDGSRDHNNPDNLRWGTRQENVDQRDRDGRTVRGKAHPNARLVAAEIQDIRRLADEGTSQRTLARRFGVSRGAIQSLLAGESWGWVK